LNWHSFSGIVLAASRATTIIEGKIEGKIEGRRLHLSTFL
jgi:hypothetical protein